MNFDFSDDQKLIQSEARKLLNDKCPPELVRSIMEDEQQPYAEALWKQIAEMGWMATAIPEAYDGLGLGYLELCVIAEELGRAAAPVPFSSTVYLFAEAVKLYGSEAQKKRWLPRVASGELIGCLAATEGFGNSDQADDRSGNHASVASGQLSGKKLAVADGDVANAAVVYAKGPEGQGLYLVDLAQSSVAREAVQSLDLARSYANLVFDAAECELLGDAGTGKQMLSDLRDRAAVLFAFEQVGGAEAALDMGVQYTTERFAFGRPVASFQAIKHKFADMFVSKELARSNAYYGAWALSSGAIELPLAAARARVSAIAAYDECSRENLQAHGGMGFTWEFDCHLHYRRAHLLALVIGSGYHWRQLLATRLLAAEV